MGRNWLPMSVVFPLLTLIICKTVLQSGALEHHRKARLTKNKKMTIALAKDMARSTTDLSDELLERWLELRRCFSA